MIDPESETVEVLRLSEDGVQPASHCARGEMVRSAAFPGLEVAVDEVFAG